MQHRHTHSKSMSDGYVPVEFSQLIYQLIIIFIPKKRTVIPKLKRKTVEHCELTKLSDDEKKKEEEHEKVHL